MPKFTIEEHEKRIRELLTPKPEAGQRPKILQSLLDRAKTNIKKPVKGELEV